MLECFGFHYKDIYIPLSRNIYNSKCKFYSNDLKTQQNCYIKWLTFAHSHIKMNDICVRRRTFQPHVFVIRTIIDCRLHRLLCSTTYSRKMRHTYDRLHREFSGPLALSHWHFLILCTIWRYAKCFCKFFWRYAKCFYKFFWPLSNRSSSSWKI